MLQRTLPGAVGRSRLAPAAISDGTLQALKWIALVLMTGDHVDKFLMHESSALLFNAGRPVMPIFAIILGINLARTSAMQGGAVDRTVGRLLVTGVVATGPFMLLQADIVNGWPLNILFTLAVAGLVIQCLQRPSPHLRVVLATGVFITGGALVEFWWPGVALAVGTWLVLRERPWFGGALCVFGFAGTCAINLNAWALIVIPIFVLASRVPVTLPRYRNAFYLYYPAHLMAIWLIGRHLGTF